MSSSTRNDRGAPSPDPAGYTVLILAGGMGTRLSAAVPDRPKVLAEVAGQPFIAHLLRQLERAGFRDVILCTGHAAARVEQHATVHSGTLKLRFSREKTPLGTGGAARRALDGVKDDHVVVMNGDSFIDLDLRKVTSWYASPQGPAAGMVATWQEDTSRFGRVELAEDGRVLHFREKLVGACPGYVNAGIYLAHRRELATLAPDAPASLERDWLPQLADGRLVAWPTRARFIDIGTPQSYAEAGKFFAALQRNRGSRANRR